MMLLNESICIRRASLVRLYHLHETRESVRWARQPVRITSPHTSSREWLQYSAIRHSFTNVEHEVWVLQ
jgi:hypothetical protein